jgi:hypothetical protein
MEPLFVEITELETLINIKLGRIIIDTNTGKAQKKLE